MELSTEIRQVVFTVKGRCQMCYTCVRECPAKAIRISNGQAEVIPERCIACGICTQVCRRQAKVYLRSSDRVMSFIHSPQTVVAIVDSSFPAEFDRIDYMVLVGMLRTLGFDKVTEDAFGSEIVADKYREELIDGPFKPGISANCPAVVYFVKQFYSDFAPQLAEILDPAEAMAKVVRSRYGEKIKVVYIGPCIARKTQTRHLDETLTFVELRRLFRDKGINPQQVEPSEFDPPWGEKGAIFATGIGMLKTIGLDDNILGGNIIVGTGPQEFQEALKEYKAGLIRDKYLNLLCCKGCIMGPGMSNHERLFYKKEQIGKYVKRRLQPYSHVLLQEEKWKSRSVSLVKKHTANNQRLPTPHRNTIIKALHETGKTSPDDMLDCKACGYNSCVEHAIAIVHGLAEPEMCLPYTISKLHKMVDELEVSNKKLATVQNALKQSEKLASMGQLSAGIAHELNNPLGVVIMYANLLLEETSLDSDLCKDLTLIVEQAERCKKIVSGLLNFARKSQVKYEEVDLPTLIRQSFASLIIPENIEIEVVEETTLRNAQIDTEQLTQALNNLQKNAFEAMPQGGKLTIKTEGTQDNIRISISDTGHGIPEEVANKVFEPFFTTKPVGKGTGLGLATTYGIIKMHKGKISVVSNCNPEKGPVGTTFFIDLPRYRTSG